MTKNSTEKSELRKQLLSNGYHPLPLADKGVYIKGWSRQVIDEDWLEQFRRVGRYGNTGLRCDNLLAFDIDVLDPDLADACEALVEDMAGPTEFCRYGLQPKRLLLYRLDGDPIRSGRTGRYGGHLCELLATHGRQFAAYGIHPGTGRDYYWDAEHPAEAAWETLPALDGGLAHDILDALDGLLGESGYPKERNAYTRTMSGSVVHDLEPSTEVVASGEIVRWDVLSARLDEDGEFGNLWREEYNDWGDSDAVHFFLAHGSGEPCAHDFVNDCTHYGSTWNPEFAELLPPEPEPKDSVFVPDAMAEMMADCVILADKTVRRLSSPMRVYPIDGWRTVNQHLRVADPNPPKSNPNKTIPFVKAWEMAPETLRADYAALRPDREESIFRDGSETVMNTYAPPEHEGSGEIATFAEFIAHLLPKDGEAQIFMEWLAHKVQHPGRRMHGLVMVTPSFGTGRGTLTRIMGLLFGRDYVKEVELRDLVGAGSQGQYNEFLADTLLVTVSEALEQQVDTSKWAARHVAYERLKTVCDPTSNQMHVKRKYGRNSIERVFASLFISSNHIDALAIEPGDRRLIVLDNTETPLIEAPDGLCDRIQRWLLVPGNIAELHRRLSVLKGKYNPYAQPPMTPAKERMIEAGRSDADRLFELFIEACKGDVVTAAQWRTFANTQAIAFDLDLPADPKTRDKVLDAVLKKKARKPSGIPSSGIKVKGRVVRPWMIRGWDEKGSTPLAENEGKTVFREFLRSEILRNGDPGGAIVELPVSE